MLSPRLYVLSHASQAVLAVPDICTIMNSYSEEMAAGESFASTHHCSYTDPYHFYRIKLCFLQFAFIYVIILHLVFLLSIYSN